MSDCLNVSNYKSARAYKHNRNMNNDQLCHISYYKYEPNQESYTIEINSIISKSSWELNCKTSQKLKIQIHYLKALIKSIPKKWYRLKPTRIPFLSSLI
jgi:hypothetical protein